MRKLKELYEELKTIEYEMEQLQTGMNLLDNEDNVALSRYVLQNEYEARRTMLERRLNSAYELNPKSNAIILQTDSNSLF